MFFDGEGARIQRDTENLPTRDDSSPRSTDGKHEQLGDNTSDGDRWVTEEEELVETLQRWVESLRRRADRTSYRNNNGPDDTEEPRPEGTDGNGGVVGVGDSRADLGVGRIVLCRLMKSASEKNSEEELRTNLTLQR